MTKPTPERHSPEQPSEAGESAYQAESPSGAEEADGMSPASEPETGPEAGAATPDADANPGDRVALGRRVEELESALAQAQDKMVRALAEADNARKRAVRDREEALKFANSAFARDLLDFADNFRRALESVPEDIRHSTDQHISGILQGIEAMDREITAVFERHGIAKLEPLDEIFDPNFHEVMFEAPAPGKAPGTIVQLVEPGYTLNGRLLRPARVGVAKADAEGAGAEGVQDASGQDSFQGASQDASEAGGQESSGIHESNKNDSQAQEPDSPRPGGKIDRQA